MRIALRHLGKDTGFTLTAGLTLAVCIGANVALFSVVDHVLLRPLGIPDSDRVLLVYNSYPKAGVERASATVPDYLDRLRDLTVFEEQALFNTRNPSLDFGGVPERVHVMQVTPSFFRLTRVPPRLGRGFTDEEGELGRNRVVILSEGLRQRLFGGREALGDDLRIDGVPHTVVGIMPSDFRFTDPKVTAWLPLAFTDEQKTQRYSNNFAYLGRLHPDATLEQAQSQIDALAVANLERFPESKQVVETTGLHTVVTRLQDDLVREVRSMLYLLWGGALFVLLIGCVNVASLVLVRSRARLRELATRLALGASRLQVGRQLVAEHVILALAAAGGGLLIGYAALRLFGALGLDELPRGTEITIDAAVIFYTLVTATLIGGLLGAIPVLGLPVELMGLLREEGRAGTGGPGVRSIRRAMIVAQVGVAFVLLVGAGLLLASFRRVLAVDPGFSTARVLTASVTLPPARYADATAMRRFREDAVRALRSIPGVEAAAATSSIPFGDSFSQDVMLPEGFRLGPGDPLTAAFAFRVSPGYFETMGARLVSGRFFEDRDTADGTRPIIVDERLAERYWSGLDPIGRRMFEPGDEPDITAINDETEWFTVVGVVGEMKVRGPAGGAEIGAFYLPQVSRNLTFTVRTAAAPLSIGGAVRQAIGGLDRELPVFDVQTMEAWVDRSLASRRSAMVLSVAFASVAVFLSGIGIYGVLAYLVNQRTREIGIRLALGSTSGAVVRLVLGEALALVAVGLGLGLGGAVALARSLQSQLFEVRATDPAVLAIAVATLGIIALAACAVPARRATRIDPVVALAE